MAWQDIDASTGRIGYGGAGPSCTAGWYGVHAPSEVSAIAATNPGARSKELPIIIVST